MADVVSRQVRSRMMAGIRGKNTKPEILVRSFLHRQGFRFRLHVKDLPGKPDLVLAKYRAAIFVHGCFWHGHDCHLFRLPGTRTDFWSAKIEGNRVRDLKAFAALRSMEWRVLVIWECALRGRTTLPIDRVIRRSADWIRGTRVFAEILGSQ